jgi:sarcosine oxidase, subunit alpha
MIQKELIIIGGGPAGLCAAKTAAEAGCHVLIVERSNRLGGQLIKQTHKFFGSEKTYAKTRGFDIAKKLIDEVKAFEGKIEIMTDATVIALYDGLVITVYQHEIYHKFQAGAIVVATGASEKFLAFENNDLPGIYGAGAVQTLMNLYGVLPGQSIVMVGSGNIGLIVSYQLIQAGVKVKALLEAAPKIGGYLVHASKLRRLGVPILVSTTIKKALGQDTLEGIETVKLDEKWNQVAGSEEIVLTDAVCISVGLSPLHQLLSMAGVEMKFVNELGGLVPKVDESHETSIPNLFVAGDVVGIEEASSAIIEGYIVGLNASAKLGHIHQNHEALSKEYHAQLDNLRSGPFGAKTRNGLAKLRGETHAR